jgi:hypothetical protein
MELRFGVRCDIPISPDFDQDGRVQVTLLAVRGLFDTFRAVLVKADALVLASPLTVSVIVFLEVWAALN